MKKVAILTPTYNRKHTLPKLYESLKNQSNNDFRWFIVDDGSKDNTGELINKWKNERLVDISYLKKENAGKHTAINLGISIIREQLVFIVDSDDYITENAVELIIKYADKYEKMREKEKLCGFCFLRYDSQGNVNVAPFSEAEFIGNYIDTRINNGLGGDKAEVFYREVLKEYPFIEYPGEKFMPEDAVWISMSQKYNMVHANEKIYICDYLEGGLTRTGRRMKIHSPKGMVLRSKLFINDQRVCMKVRIKMMLLYIIYSCFAQITIKEAVADINYKGLFYILMLPGIVIYKKWKMELRSEYHK